MIREEFSKTKLISNCARQNKIYFINTIHFLFTYIGILHSSSSLLTRLSSIILFSFNFSFNSSYHLGCNIYTNHINDLLDVEGSDLKSSSLSSRVLRVFEKTHSSGLPPALFLTGSSVSSKWSNTAPPPY